MIEWTSEMVTSLSEDHVFVFGSNEGGFHGAGTAGLAFRGDSRDNWRDDPLMQGAIGHPGTKGLWAVFGVGRGYQEGTAGKSFAVATVTRPGARRSVPRREIYFQLVNLWTLAASRPDLEFLVTPLGEGYAGWSRAEMAEVWEYLHQRYGTRSNVRFVGRR